MQRPFFSCAILALVLATCGFLAQAQTSQTSPDAPTPQTDTASATARGPKFPAVKVSNFTAAAPTKADIDGFLHTSWGYDPNRVWEIWGIQKTASPGVSKVMLLVGEKPHPQLEEMDFFVMPDGHHIIVQNALIDFGPHPYQENYKILQQRANGPSQGSKSRQFELVEFADFECPHCREAQPVVQQLLKDFPQARYVFQYFPLVNIHPMAMKAAEFAACVNQLGGNADFFKYADSVFQAQAELEGPDGELALRNAVTGIGLDPDKIAACSISPTAKAAVETSMRLGTDLQVDETPTLFIDGRSVPMMGIPYPQLKKIIEWQFQLDGSGQ